MPAEFAIRDFRASDQDAFKALNLAWIETLFEVEPSDLVQLEQPEETILGRDGFLFVADLAGEPVGTIGLVPHGEGRLEIIKMAVSGAHRGLGIGRALLAHALDFARQRGAVQIWLETNSKLEAATHLYEAAGFRALSPAEFEETPYARCDLQMICDL